MPVDFRYRGLGYLSLGVTDIEKSTDFATNIFGLDLSDTDGRGGRYFRGSLGHHDIVMEQAAEPTFIRSAWELESDDDLDRAHHHFEQLGLRPRWLSAGEAQDLWLERAFRLLEPTTRSCFEYFTQMTTVSAPRQNHLTAFQGGIHFGLVVEDAWKTAQYLSANMGFRISDYMETRRVALLRAFPNPNHHSFAPLQFGPGLRGFQHVAFMVQSIDDIGRLFNRVQKNNVKIQFGIGRHPTSGSIHLYVYDSDLMIWEYTFGMEQFPEQAARQPRRMSAKPEDTDLWGAVPDAEFFGHYARILEVA